MDPGKAKKEILDKLTTVIDPEIGIDIVNLGLVYGVEVDLKSKKAVVKLTMTTPACPLMGVILMDVEGALEKVELVEKVTVELVWNPPWTQEKMSEKAKRMLGVTP